MSSCEICFIDCMSYWDMSSQIISLLLLTIIISKTTLNIYNLHTLTTQQTPLSITTDEQLTKSHKRKLIVNTISIIYQLSLLIAITFSLLIFLVYMDDMRQVNEDGVNLWYKWSQIIFINLLNCLNLTVGLMYWKAVRLYYKLSEQHIPIIYNKWIKVVFGLFYFINLAIIIVSLVMLLTTDQTHLQQYQIKIINIVNSLGVGCSTIVCLASRFLYQSNILNNMRLNKQALNKQNLYSLLIAVSGCCRLACMVLNLFGIDYSILTRQFNQQCLDQMPYHAILMSFVTIVINIIPPVIFGIIFQPFVHGETHKKSYHQINHYLCKNDQSVRYV